MAQVPVQHLAAEPCAYLPKAACRIRPGTHNPFFAATLVALRAAGGGAARPPALSSDLLHEAVEPCAQLTAALRKRVDRSATRAGGRDLAPDTAEIELQTLDLEVPT